MIKCVAVHVGYCEDGQIGIVTFTHPKGYKTSADAVRSLANGIFTKLKEDHYRPSSKACCKKTLEKDPEATYCSKCRAEVGEKAVDFEEYSDDVRQLLTSTADSFGGEEIIGSLTGDEDEAYEWHPWNTLKGIMELKPTEVVEISCYGERVLTAMLSPERLPEKAREDLQGWTKGTYFDNSDRKELGLPAYKC